MFLQEVDPLILALVPAFAAGFAIQQLIELVDPIIVRFGLKDTDKKLVLGVMSLILGALIVLFTPVRILDSLGYKIPLLDGAVTALFISGGTEGLNSIIKFLGYTKEKEKADAAKAKATPGTDASAQMLLLNRAPKS